MNEDVLMFGSSFRRKLWDAYLPSIVWSIWLEHNNMVFQGKVWVAWWMVGSAKFRGVSILDICRDWASVDYVQPHVVFVPSVQWPPPDLGLLELVVCVILAGRLWGAYSK